MNRKILLILLILSGLGYGQYGNKLSFNSEAWTGASGSTPPTGWIGSVSAKSYTILSSDTLRIENADGGGNGNVRTSTAVESGESYKVDVIGFVGDANATIQLGNTAGGTQYLFTGVDGSYTITPTTTTLHIRIFNTITTANAYGYADDIIIRKQLDTLYISESGSDAALGDVDNPIATIAEALSRGFYDGGVFAFRSGDTFNETFTAGNNCELIVYGGSSGVTITTIADGGFMVTQSALINPVANKKSKYGRYNSLSSYLK